MYPAMTEAYGPKTEKERGEMIDWMMRRMEELTRENERLKAQLEAPVVPQE